MGQFYTRDALNRMTHRDIKKGATTLDWDAYYYDEMNRLTGVDRTGAIDDWCGYYLNGELNWIYYGYATSNYTVVYTLDKAGNRLSVDYGSGPRTYTPDVINQYSVGDGTAVTNGSEHEIASVWGSNYTYINDGPLASINAGATTTQFAYDALRRLVKRSVNGSPSRYYLYDGERIIFEYNAAGGVVGRNVYGKGIDEILMRTATGLNGGQPYYYQQDHLGSVTHLTNATGTVIEKYRYDAFGAPTFYNASGTDIGATAYGNSFLFTGRRLLSWDTYEYRARIYNMYLGRFMSEDPKLYDAGDYNLFRYCHNDPVDLTDPMGLETLVIYNDVIHYYTNPFGHVAVATTGQGLHSHGNNPNTAQHTNYSHSSVTDYLKQQALKRDSAVVRIQTTPAQEKKINEYMDALKDKKTTTTDNCATRVSDALRHAGLDVIHATFPETVKEEARRALGGIESRIDKGEVNKAQGYKEFDRRNEATKPPDASRIEESTRQQSRSEEAEFNRHEEYGGAYRRDR